MVGKGAFGKVRIVERKDTGLTFALKYIRKEEGMRSLVLRWHPSSTFWLTAHDSCSFRERTEYYSRKEDVGAPEPSLPVQFAIQFPGYGIHVRFYSNFLTRVGD